MTVSRFVSRIVSHRLGLATLLWLVLLPFAAPAGAHSEAAPAAASAAATALEPRVEAASADVELLGIVDGLRLVVYVDHFATNVPIDGAKLSVERAGQSFDAQPLGDGVYRFELPWLAMPGSHPLLFTLVSAELSDLLTATLDLPGEAGGSGAAVPALHWLEHAWDGRWRAATIVLGAVVLVVLAWVVVSARRRRALLPALLVLILPAVLLPALPAQAHESAPAPVAASPKQPSRLSDGSVFVPMLAQRAIGLRTRVGEASTVPVSIELSGRVVPDPAASGLVQAPVAGRLEPGPDGLPYPGRRVARGAVLAWVVPTVSAVDRSARQAELASLDAQVEIARARSERYAQLVGSIPQRDIDAARTEAQALLQRRSALASGLSGRIALVAPVSGVVATAEAANGQVVDARDLLFRIVDPSRLMVEAIGYDTALAATVTGGSALATDGRAVRLEWLGSGGQLREQALPMLFRVAPGSPPLVVGERLRVVAATRSTRSGIVLPASSVTRAASGETVAWVQSSAERFTPARVAAVALDAERVVVTSGLEPGLRVVTAAAGLLSQIR